METEYKKFTFEMLEPNDFFTTLHSNKQFMKIETFHNINAVALDTGETYYFPDDEEVYWLNRIEEIEVKERNNDDN